MAKDIQKEFDDRLDAVVLDAIKAGQNDDELLQVIEDCLGGMTGELRKEGSRRIDSMKKCSFLTVVVLSFKTAYPNAWRK